MKCPRILASTYDFARRVTSDYSRDHGSLIAAALSFYAFLALIPLVLLVISIAAFFLGSVEEGQSAVMRLLSQYYPLASSRSGESIRAIVQELIAGRATVTGLSAVLLLWAGLTVMHSLSKAINVAWNINVRRNLLAQRLTDFVLLVATVAMLGASLGMTAFIELVRGLNIRLLGLTPNGFPLVWQILSYLVPLAVTMAAFTIVYRIAPNIGVPTRVALLGGVFSGVMWEMGKFVFGYYVSHFVAASSIYGSLGGVMLLLVWINYSSVVTVMGAEVASEWQKGTHR